MPSWPIHEKWGLKLNIPINVLREVNRIIDTIIHDLGRKLIVNSVRVLVVDIIVSVKRGLDLMIQYLKESSICSMNFDDCLRAAALHHLLDVLELHVRGYGWHVASNKSSRELLDESYRYLMKRIREQYIKLPVRVKIQCKAKEYKEYPPRVKDFISKLNDVKNALATYSDEVVHDVIEHVKHKGGPAIGEKFVLELLRLLRQCNIIIHGDIEVNGKVVPLALAVKRIFSCIKNYGEVKIKIQSSTGIIKLKANSIIELIREIINLLEQFLINES